MTQNKRFKKPDGANTREVLLQILSHEQEQFERQVLRQGPEYRGGKKAFEYIFRQKIVDAIRNGKGDAEVLLRTPKPLKSMYHELKYYFDELGREDCFIDDYVHRVIDDCVNNTLRKEFLRGKGWSVADEFDLNEEGE